MKNLNFILLIAFVSLLFGCSSNDKNSNELSYSNDIDQMIGWTQHPTIIKGNAHSGKYMCFVDTTNTYSYAFSLPFEDLSNKSVKKINASVWGKWMAGDVTLVVNVISKEGKSLAWNGLKFNQVTPNPDEWAQIEVSLDIPSFIPSDSKFIVYMWSQDKGIGFCDDFEISFE